MRQDKDGNYHFLGKKGRRFIFTKDNFLKHCQKHQELQREDAPKDIEDTLNNYEVLTKHNPTGSTNYYRVLKVINPKYNTQIEVCKVYSFKKGNKLYIIAGADYIWGLSYQIINTNEEIIWKNHNSQIS